MLRIVLNECFRYTVIDVLHPTVFSLADSFDPFSGRWGFTHLQLFAELGIMGSFLFDLLSADEPGMMFAIK